MIPFLKNIFELLKGSYLAWIGGTARQMGAALSFYALFAIAPLFIIALAVAGLCFGQEAAHRELMTQISGLVDPAAAKSFETMMSAAVFKPQHGALATIIAAVTFLVGASGLFIQLQKALNSVWKVKLIKGWGLRMFVKTRLVSFAMVLGVGFLLLTSLVVNAVLAILGRFLHGLLPHQALFWGAANFLISLGLITALFALIYKFLPEVVVRWRDVWIGGFIAALFFNTGKYLFGLYLSHSHLGPLFGGAGSMVILLMWVYYSAQILFFGAEATRVSAFLLGSRPQPKPGSRFIGEPEVVSHRHSKRKRS